jgi:hypothetical protein
VTTPVTLTVRCIFYEKMERVSERVGFKFRGALSIWLHPAKDCEAPLLGI